MHFVLRVVLLLFIVGMPLTNAKPSVDRQGTSVVYRGDSISDGIMAVMGSRKHVTPKLATRIERDVMDIVSRPGNRWMDPFILVGLAINESDLRWWIASGTKSGGDCGVAQVNVGRLNMSPGKRARLCKRLRKSIRLSFVWAMKELNEIKRKYCTPETIDRIIRYHRWTRLGRLPRQVHFWRCILDVYNQGPRFLLRQYNTCKLRRELYFYLSDDLYAKAVRRCKVRRTYWVRSLCFAHSVRLASLPMKKRMVYRHGKWVVKYKPTTCRKVWSYDRMMKMFRDFEGNS